MEGRPKLQDMRNRRRNAGAPSGNMLHVAGSGGEAAGSRRKRRGGHEKDYFNEKDVIRPRWRINNIYI